MGRLTIPDVRVDEHTTRRSVIDVAAVREHAMEFYCRLKAYEDTGIEPEAVETVKLALCAKHMVDLETLNNTPISRLVELAEADKDGRVVVLPCNGYSDIEIVRNGISYKPAHWNIHLMTFAHGQNTPSGLKVGLFDIGEVERAMQEMEDKKNGNETNM